MKKIILVIILTVPLLISFNMGVVGVDDEKALRENIEGSLNEIIESDVRKILEDMGIDTNNLAGIKDFSLEKISDFFGKTLKEKISLCSKNCLMLLSAIMIIGAIHLITGGKGERDFVSVLSVVIITLLTVSIIKDTLSAGVSALKLSAGFMTGYIPVYTLIISLSGSPASALTYNTLLMGFSQTISTFVSDVVTDIIGMFMCLSISFTLNPSINSSRLISFINRIISLALGLFSAVFTGFLSIRNVLSVSVDSVGVKGIRFLISSLIPVVGSSISDAYSSLLGSINLIKGSVAVVGIVVVIIINLPIICEALIYYFALTVMSFAGESIALKGISDCLRSFAFGIKILLLLCVFEMFILIISTGIMLSVRGGL